MKYKKQEKGAVIVEATLVIPMFIFLVITIMWVVNLCTAQAKVQIAVNNAAKEIASFSYLYGLTGINEERALNNENGKDATVTIDNAVAGMQSICSGLSNISDAGQQVYSNGSDIENILSSTKDGYEDVKAGAGKIEDVYKVIKNDPKKFLISLGSATVNVGINQATSYLVAAPLGKFFAEKHLKTATLSADEYMKKLGVVGGFDGIDFSMSTFCNSGSDEIKVVAAYQISPIKFFNIDVKYNMIQAGKTKAWFGADSQSDEN